jgi:hypothetical protein
VFLDNFSQLGADTVVELLTLDVKTLGDQFQIDSNIGDLVADLFVRSASSRRAS